MENKGAGVKQRKNLIDTDNSMLIMRRKGAQREVEEDKGGLMVREGDLTQNGEDNTIYK